MFVGNRYTDEKMYSGIKHYDGLPLTSSDIHEYADLVQQKHAYFMNNIIGSGTLNEPNCSISGTGISLLSPVVALIEGDISLIQSDSHIVSRETIESAGYEKGILCIVGWYQHLTSNDVLRTYGGVNNSIIENDIMDPDLKIQVSTRYQLRWDIALVDYDEYMSGNPITLEIPSRDKEGNILEGTVSLDLEESKSSVRVVERPTSMDYAVSDIYVLPILEYGFSNSNITRAKVLKPIRPIGSSNLLVQEETPTGDFYLGTEWYNPSTREFKKYVGADGFVDSASKMGFLQYQSLYEIPEDIPTAQDIKIPINISTLQDGDVLTVAYEGLVLILNDQYTIDYSDHTITLRNFTVNKGERVIFTAIKIVEANDITNITTTFTTHMNGTGSPTIKSHVKLTDNIDSTLDAYEGTAATPKAVHNSRIVRDINNNTGYMFGVENGMLFIMEVE